MSEPTREPLTPILLVEPHGPNAMRMQEMLIAQFRSRLDLSLAHTFREAVSHLCTHRVDLILMNLALTDAKSGEAIRALRSAAPAGAFIAISATADEASVMEALRSGAHEVLSGIAPTPEDLQRTILRAFARMAAPAGSRPPRFAHDINNLVTTINGYADILLARLATNDPARISVEQIRKAGTRAALLVKSLSPDPSSSAPSPAPPSSSIPARAA